MKVKIQPWTYNDKTAVNIEVPTIFIMGGKKAVINCALTDENSVPIYASRIDMPKEDYDQWVSDDLYIVNYCANVFNPPAIIDGPLSGYSELYTTIINQKPPPSGSAPTPSGSAP